MTKTVLFFNTEQEAIAAELQIRANCDIPPGDGTLRWSDVIAFESGFIISYPDPQGWRFFSREEMLAGVGGEVREITINQEIQK